MFDTKSALSSNPETLALVINLARSPDRLALMRQQLAQTSLQWERFEAVEGAKLPLPNSSLLDTAEYERRHGKTFLPGELGCFLSHVYAYEYFLKTDKKYALILEDDVKLHPELESVLSSLYACENDWDLVKLSGVHRGAPVKVKALGSSAHLAVAIARCTGSSAYIINRHAAKQLAQGLLPMRLPFDHEFDRAWHYGFKHRIVQPWPCGHDQENVSLIGQANGPRRKFVWYRRLTAHVWRLKNEFNRAAHGVAQVLLYRQG